MSLKISFYVIKIFIEYVRDKTFFNNNNNNMLISNNIQKIIYNLFVLKCK